MIFQILNGLTSLIYMIWGRILIIKEYSKNKFLIYLERIIDWHRRDVACYVSTRPYFFVKSRKRGCYFQSIPN